MKGFMLRFLHLFMAVVVLLSSMGFGLVDQTCQMRGKRTYLIHQHGKSCEVAPATASDPAAGPVIKRTACCIEKTRYEKVDTGSSLSQGLIKFVQAVHQAFGPALAAVFTALFSPFFPQTAVLSAPPADPPALPAGRTLLVLVQAFLI